MQLVLQEILDLLFGESSCGDVDSGGSDQDTLGCACSPRSRGREKQVAGGHLADKALGRAGLINWSASLRGLREHLKKHTVDNLII